MFDTRVDELDVAATLAHARGLRALADRAEAQILVAAAHYADLHTSPDPATDGQALPGTQRLVSVGGEGTPAVAEFAAAELGAELAISASAASRLVADALDLRHRLPRLWARVLAGQVKPWIARNTAAATRTSSAAVAAAVDTAITPWAHSLSWYRLDTLIAASVIRADPAAAAARAEAAERAQGVWVNPSTEHGIKTLYIRTTAPHAIWFDATVDHLADTLKLRGDTASKDVRRATAVGILAHPQHALDLLTTNPGHNNHDTDTHGGDRTRKDCTGDGSPTSTDGGRRRPGRRQPPPATLYVHLGPDALTAGTVDGGGSPVARMEGVGPITVDQARRFLRHCHVSVKPVLDLAGQAPVDAYEIPDQMREAIHLRSPVDMFPYATNTSRHTDLDHTIPHTTTDTSAAAATATAAAAATDSAQSADGNPPGPPGSLGPPGQTRTDNLAPLTRLHHRIKTHGRWHVRQPFNGILIWKSPHGRYYLVDHTGTQRLHTGTQRLHPTATDARLDQDNRHIV
ncbi:MAG TPA: DUF222 domain-containing protein [Nocardioidaceae bacterium]|nr:DUF222 domain-containing protein [Nocardioidaceae bacterium]